MFDVDKKAAPVNECTLVLTARCNLDCRYCTRHSEEGPEAERGAVLEACRRAAADGARRFQLAGGEPLLFDGLPSLVREMKNIPGVEWIGLTTNGTLLYPALPPLKEAGLDAVNLHMDACDAYTFTAVTGKSQMLNEILKSVWSAVALGVPLTVTSVMLEDNAQNLAVLAGLARRYNICVRFVTPPPQSVEAGPDERAALEILGRSIKGFYRDGNLWRAPCLKGNIEFGRSIWGAFGMENGRVLHCV